MSKQIVQTENEELSQSGLLLSVEPLQGSEPAETLKLSADDTDGSDTLSDADGSDEVTDTDATDATDTDTSDGTGADTDGTDGESTDTDGTDSTVDADSVDA